MGFSAGDHRFDSACLPCAPWVNWLARSQLKCPSGVFVLGARGMTLTHSLDFKGWGCKGFPARKVFAIFQSQTFFS